MNKILLSLMLLFSISPDFSFAAACADSVTIKYYFHHTTNSDSYTITIDTFDLDSGIVTICQSISPDPYTVPSYSCSNSYWTKKIVTLNTAGDTTEILLQTGSTAGWVNLSRRVFNYDPVSGFELSESDETWNGISWDQTTLHQWIYNVSNQLTEETTQQFSGGNTNNQLRILWNYSGNILNSKTIQKGSGNIWLNDKNYFFIYDINGIRDSVRYSEWNAVNLVWDVIGTSLYHFNPLKIADFIIVKPINLSGFILNDSISFSIDTLENFIYYYELIPTSASLTVDDYTMNIYTHDYVNGLYRIMTSYSSTWWDDHSGFGLNWYCTDDDQGNIYDSAGYLIMNTQSARCVMPNIFTTNYYYNADHLLLRETGWLDANTQENSYTIDNYFAAADSLIIYMHPWVHVPHPICMGDNFSVPAFAAGGCGSYNFSWSPTYGISSANVSDPLITVHDSTVYTVTVTDSTGQTASTQLPVYPQIQINITIDSSACSGCPMVLNATYSPDYTYQWYYNGSPIANSDTSSITASANGLYYVVGSLSAFCSYTSHIMNLVTLNNEKINIDDLDIYPNPTSGLSKLTFNSNERGNIRVSMNNMEGEETLLYDGVVSNGFSLLLNGNENSSGIYVITVRREEGVRKVLWVVGK